jgi:hypothetical protein
MRKILFICGSLNQTTMMHRISEHLKNNYDCWFTPYYTDGFKAQLVKRGFLDFTILGGKFKAATERYIEENNLRKDYRGIQNNYELVITCTDLIVQKNIKKKKIVLIQEGMTDPENIFFYLSKYLKFPRYLASTSTTGLSDAYISFCVASEGYKNLFIKKGCNPAKIHVTGIPNFDNCRKYEKNHFPYNGYVLVCTSDARETLKPENRKKFIRKALQIANGKSLIFKLHPNEKFERASREIREYAPGALVFSDGNTNEMIANCSTLITKYSSVVYIGLALGKEVYSSFDINKLKLMTPLQNNGDSAKNIAGICEHYINGYPEINYNVNDSLIPVPEY